ncbi:MAG TPA: hypothetical protein VKA08_09915 [Balneolales bacterium]|nr:hypothetical protein [Balneolales bacterium]
MVTLKENGLKELNSYELNTINGGGLSELLLGLLGAAIYDCIANHEEFTKGFVQGYRDATS